jgi:hypothetical protein
MSDVPTGRRAMTAALSSMLIMAAVLIPLAGIAIAATPPSNCQTFPGESEISFSQCWLDIAAPSSVRTGVAFTVQVRVTTDETNETVANTDPCGSKAPITLDLVGEGHSESQTVNASAGIATFSFTIPFGRSGTYGLHADGPDGEVSAAATADCDNTSFVDDTATLMAVDIPADSPIAPCPPDTNCEQATSGSGTQATLIADEGSTWTDVGFQGEIPGGDCAGDPRQDPNGVLRFELTGTTDNKVIIFALDNSQVMKGIGLFEVCWSQPLSPFMSDTGQLVTTGNLPDCKGKDQVAPCVASRVSGQHNVAFLTVLADADDPLDPFGYGH